MERYFTKHFKKKMDNNSKVEINEKIDINIC